MITLCYISNRKQPLIKYFFDSLHRELKGDYDGVEVIVVANYNNELENLGLHDRIPNILFTAPKPCVWSGKHKLTTQDYFTPSNARNTGLVCAAGSFIVYVDDLSVLVPGWWEQVKLGALGGYVICGVYQKVFELEVKDGEIVSFVDNPAGHDSRLDQLPTDELTTCPGEWCYGASLGVPVEALLSVNGFNEYDCDSMGGEDYVCGMMLEAAGYELKITKRMMTLESEEWHSQGVPAKRIIKPYPGYKDASWAVLDWVKNGQRKTSPNLQNMRELRQKILAGEDFPIPTEPTHDWRDGAELSSM